MATVALSGIITPSNVVTATSTNTLTNKTIAYGSNTLTDVVGVTATQTLTNKTLTAPTIASANLTTALTLAGAAGTNGQVLTSAGSGLPTWSTPSSGALVFISSQTVTTTVASVDFTSGIDATYNNYYVVFSNFRLSASSRLRLRLRQSTTFVSADYVNLHLNVQTGSVITSGFSTTDTFLMANAGGAPDTNSYWSGNFTLSSANTGGRRGPVVNGYSGCVGDTGASSTIQSFTGGIDVAGVITGFQFLATTGNLTAGTVALYGIKTS